MKEIRDSLLDYTISYTRLKSIDQIPDEVIAHIKELAERLNLPPQFTLDIEEDVEYLNQIFNVRKGNLPVEEYAPITLPAGEILHYEISATYEESGTRHKEYEGSMYITDRRVIFQSWKKKFEFPYHKVINVYVSNRDVTINLNRKAGSGSYTTSHNHLVGEMIEWLVKTASRQVIATQSGATRFIPQEVKIVVWQRDQGRCVQCGAQEYLEFDHIIPFSMGGATSASNLQLLCRKCNLSKGGRL